MRNGNQSNVSHPHGGQPLCFIKLISSDKSKITVLSQDFQPRPVWKAANSFNRAITKRRLDSCSRGANAENIPLGVVSLIAGCSGLKGGFSSPCLWKSWAEVVMIEVRGCCWLRFDFSRSVILQPIPKTFLLKNGSSCSCLSLVPLMPHTKYLFQWLTSH